MESSKVTSKTSSLKALLLRAWRERWSDLHWGIHIKTILPRGVSGDVYNLADCILQQALVGPAPNQLVLSYLKHSLSSQLVSYASVLQRIAKYDGFQKPYCINCLLEFIETIQSGITCRGKPEEGILASAILSLVHWLLQCYQHELSAEGDLSNMLTKPASILNNMLNCGFLTSMLYLAKHDDKELYNDVVKKCHDIEELLSKQAAPPPGPSIQEALIKLCDLELGATSLTTVGNRDADVSEPLTYCVQALLAVQVRRKISAETSELANQLKLLQRLKGYKMSRLCCEVIRASFMSLNDVLVGIAEDSKWGAFTFIKLPQILLSLAGSNITASPEGDYSEDVVEAVQQLLQFVPLIDLMDSPSSFNCIEALLNDLTKLKLLNESHVKAYVASRDSLNLGLPRLENTGSLNILQVINRTKPTLRSILKTLELDHSKIQEALPNVLCQVPGNSFELILSVAAVEGHLKYFVSKLVKFNEASKSGSGSRSLLFDVTFIMLCYVVQQYGSQEVFDDDNDSEDKSFFQRWVEGCMIEKNKPKCPDALCQQADPSVVDALLSQLNAAQPDLATIGVGWDVICLNVPAAMKEVAVAWEQGALSATDVKRILDNMKQTMCCLPICASNWLCSYMQVLQQDALLKPMNMVQQLLTPLSNEDTLQENFKERSVLMIQVIRKMQHDMHLATSFKVKSTTSHSIISKEPMSEELSEVWNGVQEKGWLTNQDTHSLENLFVTAGPNWFVYNLVKEIMKLHYKEELDRAVDLALAVFHLDIETCTEVLLTAVLPQYLHNVTTSEDLYEPQCSALAKLCAYCTYAAWQSQNANNRKRPHPLTDEADEIASKLLLLEEGPLMLKGPPPDAPQVPPLRGPLLHSLKILFNSFSLITEHTPYISQQTHFVFRVLEMLVMCGRDQTKPILQGMPNTLVPSLVRALPHMFSTDLVLRLYDLSSAAGRKATASDLCLLRNLELKPSI
ncbi:U1 small nuclear ribonucleoprotein C [Nesidiocoris tenuis]|nr:U1 small nuclear ribonucleoprotein C [Nesidiocoris tenuis]